MSGSFPPPSAPVSARTPVPERDGDGGTGTGDLRAELAAVVEAATTLQLDEDAFTTSPRQLLDRAVDAVLAAGYRRVTEDDQVLLSVARAIRDAYEELPDGTAPAFTEPQEWFAEARAALAALRGGEQP